MQTLPHRMFENHQVFASGCEIKHTNLGETQTDGLSCCDLLMLTYFKDFEDMPELISKLTPSINYPRLTFSMRWHLLKG